MPVPAPVLVASVVPTASKVACLATIIVAAFIGVIGAE